MPKKLEMMRSERAFKAVLAAVAITLLCSVMATAAGRPSHLDRTKNPSGCSGCHKGHGKKGTAMLNAATYELCFSCHGGAGIGRGGFARTDIAAVFNKRYHHPVVETSMYHNQGEELPEKSPSAPRHVACQDCHSVHVTEPGDTMKHVGGHKKGIAREVEAAEEYEICYKCHSESANLPVGYRNKADEFDTNNPSYHPIEASGRNVRVPSLLPPYDVSSVIKCSDCHGNNDKFGPKGPHGSDYEFMLKGQYVTTESAESPNAYELCYSCHDRKSILRNETFQKHNEHIVFYHAPCAACHTSHGSRTNRHLVDLSRFAAPTSMPSYMPSSNGRPYCYLTCHIGNRDVVHDNAFYAAKRWP